MNNEPHGKNSKDEISDEITHLKPAGINLIQC